MVGSSRGWVRGPCIGRGSTAAVYLAASASGEGEAFAVKSADLSRSATLRREEKILSSLCSSHIVSCLGSDVTVEADGRVLYNLFMEYVPGGDVSEVVKRHGGLDEHTIRVYNRGILDGLAYLHSKGIVHCDVKGRNVLVGEENGVSTVKLADLGCARWVDDGSDGRAVISGTPLYMAPEVARGEEQGPAADIWALGCTVIEMATGCPPWRDVEDPVAAIHLIAFSDNVPDFPCSLSDDARDFLERCLRRDPRKRWSAEELLSHTFVKCPVEHSADRSPKSTLDQGFWDSWPEEEEKDEATKPHMDNQPPESAHDRLRQLVSGGVPPPPRVNASWEESTCWVTIRNTQGSERPSTSCSPLAGAAAYDADSKEESQGYDDGVAVAAEGSISCDRNTGFLPAEACLDEGDGLVTCRRAHHCFDSFQCTLEVVR